MKRRYLSDSEFLRVLVVAWVATIALLCGAALGADVCTEGCKSNYKACVGDCATSSPTPGTCVDACDEVRKGCLARCAGKRAATCERAWQTRMDACRTPRCVLEANAAHARCEATSPSSRSTVPAR